MRALATTRPYKWERCIEALLTTPQLTDAAKAAGVSRQTLLKWTHNPSFQRLLAERSRERFQTSTCAASATAVLDSITNLHRMQFEGDTPEIRRDAAKICWENGLKMVELMEFSARLQALEAAAALPVQGRASDPVSALLGKLEEQDRVMAERRKVEQSQAVDAK